MTNQTIKIKIFCSLIDNVNRIKRQVTNWEKYLKYIHLTCKYIHLTCIVHSHKLHRYMCVCVKRENTYTDISKIWHFTEEDVRITNKHMKNVQDH